MATATTSRLPSPTLLGDGLAWAGWVALCLAVGFIGSQWTMPEINGWYATLNRPAFAPPSWVFGPVWTTLYILMGTSAWLVYRQGGFAAQSSALSLFLVQLGLNLWWSGIFFGQHQLGWAFVEIIALWVAIVATMVVFSYRSRLAAALLVPYIMWVTFASVLTFEYWRLNA